MKEGRARFDFPTETVREGTVEVLAPRLKAFVKAPWEYAPSKAPVFYNPVMELNRDFAVLALQAYQRLQNKPLAICEPLAGCGIRGARLAREVEGVESVVLNDIGSQAVKLARFNMELNGLGDHATVFHEDANLLLNRFSAPRRRFDYVDVDPFGSPAPYMESAVRALRSGGMLALTATDMAALCGVHPKACIRKYGGRPLRTGYCHELAVRLLAGCLARTAAKHEAGVSFVFSHSTDHYIRLYGIVKHGARLADESLLQTGYVLHCFSCMHRETLNDLFCPRAWQCPQCGSRLRAAGPLWLGKIADAAFSNTMSKEAEFKTIRRKSLVEKTLSLIGNEADAPLTYYVVDKICDWLNVPVPPVSRVVEKLTENGFLAVRTHFNTRGIRTDAPAKNVVEMIRELASFKRVST